MTITSISVPRPQIGGSSQSAEAEAAVEAERVLLDDLAQMYGDKKVTKNEWMIAKGPIQERLAAAESAVSPVSADVQALRDLTPDLWNQLPVARQQDICRLILLSVTINKATRRGFDEGRIAVEWKG